jgi:hypothetical protein
MKYQGEILKFPEEYIRLIKLLHLHAINNKAF